MHGWVGKILEVRLSDSTVSTVDTAPYAESYVRRPGNRLEDLLGNGAAGSERL